MALNFGLLGDAGAPAMGYLQGQQDVARNQLAQQQVETGRMTQDKMRMEMDAMKRRQAGLDQFMQKAKELGVDGDPEQLTQVFYEHAISTGDMQQVQAAQIARQAAKERKAYMASQPGAGGAVSTPVPTPNISSAVLPAAGAPTQVNALGAGAPPAAAPPQGNALGNNRLSQIENRLIELRQFPTAGKQERDDLIKERTELMKPITGAAGGFVYNQVTGRFEQPPEKTKKTDLQLNYQAAKDQGFTGSIFDYERKLKEATRAPAAPAQPQAPVAVVDPVTGKQVYVTREEALSKRMAPASAMEGLTPKEIQTREAKYPAATLAVKTIESSSDRLASDLEALAKHPGLSGISGLVYGNTPAITKDARVALEKYKSILARGGFAELQAMRSASPTGGALGNVSNQENQYLRDAFAAIGRSQDTADLKTALESAANVARAAKQRVRDAYDLTYDYKTGGGATTPAPKPAGGGAPPPPPGFKPDN
jgi:hypothetical protein